jgi:hypothetical protein
VLVPDEPRHLPGHRALKVGLRAAHALTASILVGGFAFVGREALASGWPEAAALSGAAILALDAYESCAFFLQVRGAVVVSKLAALFALPWLGAAQGPVLVALVLVSVVSSHAPSRVRYHLLLGGGRVRGAQTRG